MAIDRNELGAWLRLVLTPGVGNTTARRLLAQWGPPEQVFAQPAQALKPVVTDAQARALAAPPPEWAQQLERTWRWLQEPDPQLGIAHDVLVLGDPRYPERLLATEDPPLLLYVMGARHLLARQPFPADHCLAMVGSRNPTAQGAEHARLFARALQQAGLTIVSGLALGVDAAAHEGALDGPASPARAATIAVVGTGLDRVYPARNRALAHRIAEHGLLVSEYPLGTPPIAANFPKRNRIIAGLSQGTLVVEAALASGSLITARLAAEQGREVFAIPGSIHSPQSRGCHALIRQGAKLVESAQDVLEELRLPGAAPAAAAPDVAAGTPGAPADADPVLQALGFDPLDLDALVARTGMPTAHLQARLLELELDGWVARLPGGLFQRVGLG